MWKRKCTEIFVFRLSVIPVHFPKITRNSESLIDTHGLTPNPAICSEPLQGSCQGNKHSVWDRQPCCRWEPLQGSGGGINIRSRTSNQWCSWASENFGELKNSFNFILRKFNKVNEKKTNFSVIIIWTLILKKHFPCYSKINKALVRKEANFSMLFCYLFVSPLFSTTPCRTFKHCNDVFPEKSPFS